MVEWRNFDGFDEGLKYAYDTSYQKLGEIVNTGGKNEAEIKTETALADFGLLLTMEAAVGAAPAGPAVATIHIVP